MKRHSESSATGCFGIPPLLTELGIPALTALFGIQALRTMVPGLVWILSDHLGWGVVQAATVAFLVFLPAFAAGRLRRLLSNRLALVVTAGGLGLLRLLMQIWSGEPVLGLSLAMAGMTLFILFMPIYLQNLRVYGSGDIGRFALGLLLGLFLDTALHGLFDTYDMGWQAGLSPMLLTLFLILAQWMLLTSITFARNVYVGREASGVNVEGPMLRWLPLVAVGPFLFLQLVVFQNIARVAVLTGWSLPIAFGWTLLTQFAGLAVAVWLMRSARRTLWPLAIGSGLGLVAILALPYQQSAVVTALLLLVGQLSLSLLIVLVFICIGAGVRKTGLSGITIANALGMLLLLLFLIGYYLVYQVRLPYSNTLLEPVAAFIVASAALGAAIAQRPATSASHRTWLAVVLAIPLLALPLAGMVTWRTPTAVLGEGFPVRVMTYNLHNGFNTEGHLGMEDIAQVIENDHPDIVALQEISRGWVVSGRLDMLTWLSQRLQMPYVFGPTADSFWGNAIISRYPIVEYTLYELPPRDLPILRGFIVASIDLGKGELIQVISTHFHHVEEDSAIRLSQSQEIVNFWSGSGPTVLVGDLNAQPHDPEIALLRQAGFVDAMAGIGPSPAYTYPSENPTLRIDYILVSPDLKVKDIRVTASNASDHLPVVAEIDR